MPSDRPFLRIGVTGGIGAGKSTVCAAFERRGRVVLSADRIARLLMEQDPAVIAGVRAVCGDRSYRTDGSLDPAFVASRVFTDARVRERLNAAVHPAVKVRIADEIRDLPEERRHPYVLIEAALLYESGMEDEVDAVLVVHAADAIRLERLLQRDGSSAGDVKKRMRAQMPAAQKRERADFVLVNEGDPAGIDAKVAFFDLLFTRMAG